MPSNSKDFEPPRTRDAAPQHSDSAQDGALDVEVLPPDKPRAAGRPGHQPAHLRRHNERLAVGGRKTAEAVRDLRIQGLPHREVAERLGITVRHSSRLWSFWVQSVADGPSAEEKAVLRMKLARWSERLIEQGIEAFEEGSAGHGAVAIRAMEGLAKLYGLDEPGAGGKESEVSEVLANLKGRIGLLGKVKGGGKAPKLVMPEEPRPDALQAHVRSLGLLAVGGAKKPGKSTDTAPSDGAGKGEKSA